jgi:hypothetical protein
MFIQEVSEMDKKFMCLACDDLSPCLLIVDDKSRAPKYCPYTKIWNKKSMTVRWTEV